MGKLYGKAVVDGVIRRPMMRIRTRFALFGLAIAATLAGLLTLLLYNEFYDNETLRYRLTYEVEIDGEIRSGTGVVQVRVWKSPESLATSGIGFHVTGEATVVDLGDHGYLFSLLSGRPVRVNEWSTHVTSPDKLLLLSFDCPGGDILGYFHCLERTQPSVDLPFRYLPALAMLEDIDDPESIRLVEPNDLATHFGPGTELRSVTMEITSDPVTEGRIGELLPWLEDWQGRVRTPEKTFYRFDFIKSD